ncbi:MAG: hypothetical protein KTR14_03100 [Vampirovibrio sp.]|nr:hypothetical protein [Vampirovibrio sp.]
MSTNQCDSTTQQCSTGDQPSHHQASNNSSECCDMPEKLLCLADEAWKELMKEKIKAQIQSTCGEKLDNLAKIVAEANGAKWQHKIAAKHHCHTYQDNVRQFFTSHASCQEGN